MLVLLGRLAPGVGPDHRLGAVVHAPRAERCGEPLAVDRVSGKGSCEVSPLGGRPVGRTLDATRPGGLGGPLRARSRPTRAYCRPAAQGVRGIACILPCKRRFVKAKRKGSGPMSDQGCARRVRPGSTWSEWRLILRSVLVVRPGFVHVKGSALAAGARGLANLIAQIADRPSNGEQRVGYIRGLQVPIDVRATDQRGVEHFRDVVSLLWVHFLSRIPLASRLRPPA